ncbi:unnamed protein product [Prorocentrum cordatum]|uniref:PRELI/MSF1 domain-containing protein n=1 Tax=Prorocentrum cordatum TaxID=2364126 RepID=A0ABN9XN03_9DINO|nr:unnamed protein product [Polarella glacialis]
MAETGAASPPHREEDALSTKASPLYSNQHLLHHDWGAVTSAWLQKFPDPNLPQVTAVDTVERYICETEQTMRLQRVFHCTFKIPKLVERVLGKKVSVICVEDSHWDLKRRRLVVYGRNETWQHRIQINEMCCFTEVAPGQTLYTQSATVSYRSGVISGLLMPVVNELCAGVCQKNAQKGTLALSERAAKEEAILKGTAAPGVGQAPTVLALDSITGGRIYCSRWSSPWRSWVPLLHAGALIPARPRARKTGVRHLLATELPRGAVVLSLLGLVPADGCNALVLLLQHLLLLLLQLLLNEEEDPRPPPPPPSPPRALRGSAPGGAARRVRLCSRGAPPGAPPCPRRGRASGHAGVRGEKYSREP